MCADEVPLCAVTSVDAEGRRSCKQNRASTMKGNFCKGQAQTTNCAREQDFSSLDNQARPGSPMLALFDRHNQGRSRTYS